MRYALRTLVGPWLIALAAPLEVANFLQRGTPWRGEGMWTVEWFAIVLFVLGPLAAGAAAVDAARLSRPGNVHLVVSTPRPCSPYVRAALWCAVPLVAIHVLTVAAALGFGAVTRPEVGWPALLGQAGLQCLVIVWFVALGTAVGRFANPLVAGLFASVLGLFVTYVLGDGAGSGHFALLGLGSSTVSRLGLSYHSPYLLGQLLVLGATCVLLVLVPTRGVRSLRAPSAVGFGALGLVLLIVVAAQLLLPAHRLEAAPRAPGVCFHAGVPVCLFQEHRRHRGSVQRHIEALVTAARRNGYKSLVPVRVVETSRTYGGAKPGTATFTLPLVPSVGGKARIDDWAYELTNPAHCPLLTSLVGPPESYYRRKAELEVTWLSLLGVRSWQLDFDPTLRVLTPEETAAIVADFRDCRLG